MKYIQYFCCMDHYLLVSLLMEQLAQVVQAAGDGALVSVGVLQVLIWDVSAGQEGALGLIKATLIHQDDARVQVGRCWENKTWRTVLALAEH